jgi:H+/Cl- antiporter ClcA
LAGIKPLTPSLVRPFHPFATGTDLRRQLRWSLLVVPLGLGTGSVTALFLWGLDAATRLRWQTPRLLYFLPLAGGALGLIYHSLGRNAERGNNLLLEEIHQPGAGVPRRMAPLVLIGTWLTHLFGGSAGREGTALQMGGSLAAGFSRWLNLAPADRRLLLLAGIAAGFGSVFGTPIAGALFALEVVMIGQLQCDGLIPVLIAALVGDAACSAWGIHHTIYRIALPTGAAGWGPLTLRLMTATVIAGAAFGFVARAFSALTHGIQRLGARWIAFAPLRPVIGGSLVIALVALAGTRDYLGLGVTNPDPHGVSIVSAFRPGGAGPADWAWKLIFTAVTLGSGFKGGEVTPLFFIGATLGHALGVLGGVPVDLMAGLGFIAVFAGAANTPLACTILGAELFGAAYLPYFALACFVSYHCSGHHGIYRSQRYVTRPG